MATEVLAGPFLRDVRATSVTVWFATLRPLASQPILEVWNPAPKGFLAVPAPTGQSILWGTPLPVSTQALDGLWVHTLRLTFRNPLPRARVLAYRLKIGADVIAAPGTFQRILPEPGKRGTVDFATFVVPRRRDFWLIGARAASQPQLTRLAAEVEHAIVPPKSSSATPPPVVVGPTRIVLFGAPYPAQRDPSTSATDAAYIELARARLGRLLGLDARADVLAQTAAGYMLGWSPDTLAHYSPPSGPSDVTRASVIALARVMANIPTEIIGAPDTRSETATDRALRRYIIPSLQRAAKIDNAPQPARVITGRPNQVVLDEDARGVLEALAADDANLSVIASARPIVAGASDSGLISEIAQRDDTFVLCMSSGRGYIATMPPPTPNFSPATGPAGRRHEVAVSALDSSDPSVPPELASVRTADDAFASLRRTGQNVTLTLHGRQPVSRIVPLAPARLQPVADQIGLTLASPSLEADDEKRLLASLVLQVATDPPNGSPQILASGTCTDRGLTRLPLDRIADGQYVLRVGANGAGARARGSTRHVWKRKAYAVELEDGAISAIEDEPIPASGYRLELEPSYAPDVLAPSTASSGGKWGKALGPSGVHTVGNEITPLVDGSATFAAMQDVIRGANSSGHFIYLLGWWFDRSLPLTEGGPEVIQLLAAAANSGVQVRVILFEFAGIGAQRMLHYATRDFINSWQNGACIVDRLTAKYTGAHHQKLLVVNNGSGLTAFCGGVDLNRDRIEQSDQPAGKPMHDVHARVRGPAANDLLGVFMTRWLHHPRHRTLELANKPLLLPLSRTIQSVGSGSMRARVLETFNVVHEYTRSACKARRSYHDALFAAIAAAQHTIYIEDQYLVHLGIADALRAASQRVENIVILIPHTGISDLPQAHARRQAFMDRLGIGRRNSNSVGVFELRQTKEHHTYVHAKTAMFDDEVAIIGSANWNRRGMSSDSEVGILFESPTAVKGLRKQLWCEHLGCQPAEVDDALAGAALWWAPPATARIAPFDRTEAEPSGAGKTFLDAYIAFNDEMLDAHGIEAFDIITGKVSATTEAMWELIDPDAEDLPDCR